MKTAAVQRVIDANINRCIEALRVIEEYVRFISLSAELTEALKTQRHQLSQAFSEDQKNLQLSSRDPVLDLRSADPNPARASLKHILMANFSRLQEGLRVLEEYTSNTLFNRCRHASYSIEKAILLPLSAQTIKAGLYLISDNPDILIKGLSWQVSLIQLRDKNASKEQILNKALKLAPLAKKAQIPFIINDYLDIACICDADGLHIGQDDLQADQLRPLMGENKLIGKTSHSLEQGLLAQEHGADYVSVGPIWETPSKPNRQGIGFDYLKKAKKNLIIPHVAIGGIDLKNIEKIIQHSPPLIGLIRDYENIPAIQTLLQDQA